MGFAITFHKVQGTCIMRSVREWELTKQARHWIESLWTLTKGLDEWETCQLVLSSWRYQEWETQKTFACYQRTTPDPSNISRNWSIRLILQNGSGNSTKMASSTVWFDASLCRLSDSLPSVDGAIYLIMSASNEIQIGSWMTNCRYHWVYFYDWCFSFLFFFSFFYFFFITAYYLRLVSYSAVFSFVFMPLKRKTSRSVW
jgi:hypothetical protein